jgi:hypothetical protein
MNETLSSFSSFLLKRHFFTSFSLSAFSAASGGADGWTWLGCCILC